MNARRISQILSLALASGTAGWWIRDAEPHGAPAMPAPPVRQAPAPSNERTSPLIALAGDGNITLRVEQLPLEWVLEQIAVQAGGSASDLLRAVEPASQGASLPTSGRCSGPVPPSPEGELLRAIERGDETARHDGLLQARGLGMAVPDDTLKTLFETDASDRVRLLAFESWLEARADTPEAMRSALQSALYLPSAAIQQEARRLLAQLHEVERNGADSPQPPGP
jgi:hypothetical protein